MGQPAANKEPLSLCVDRTLVSKGAPLLSWHEMHACIKCIGHSTWVHVRASTSLISTKSLLRSTPGTDSYYTLNHCLSFHGLHSPYNTGVSIALNIVLMLFPTGRKFFSCSLPLYDHYWKNIFPARFVAFNKDEHRSNRFLSELTFQRNCARYFRYSLLASFRIDYSEVQRGCACIYLLNQPRVKFFSRFIHSLDTYFPFVARIKCSLLLNFPWTDNIGWKARISINSYE